MRIVLAFLLLVSGSSFAGEGSEQLFGWWNTLAINGSFKKDSPWIYFVELSERNTQDHDHTGMHFSQFVNYDGIGYKFNNNHKVYGGIWYQYTQPPYSSKVVQELNLYQQYDYSDNFDEVKFVNRMRLEERNNLDAAGVSVRFRERIKFEYPFNKEWSCIFSEEIIFNLNNASWGPYAGIDQNRVFIGFGYNFNPIFKTEIGYMNQWVDKNLKSDFIDHQLSMNFIVNVPE